MSCARRSRPDPVALFAGTGQFAPRLYGLGKAGAVTGAVYRVMSLPEIADLNEIDDMLAERVQEWTQQWKAEGLRRPQEGLNKALKEGDQGREAGRKEGETILLTRSLERRFGPLDATVKGRLESADAEQLLQWGERLLVAIRWRRFFRTTVTFRPATDRVCRQDPAQGASGAEFRSGVFLRCDEATLAVRQLFGGYRQLYL